MSPKLTGPISFSLYFDAKMGVWFVTHRIFDCLGIDRSVAKAVNLAIKQLRIHYKRLAAADPETLDYDSGRLLEKLRRVFGQRK